MPCRCIYSKDPSPPLRSHNISPRPHKIVPRTSFARSFARSSCPEDSELLGVTHPSLTAMCNQRSRRGTYVFRHWRFSEYVNVWVGYVHGGTGYGEATITSLTVCGRGHTLIEPLLVYGRGRSHIVHQYVDHGKIHCHSHGANCNAIGATVVCGLFHGLSLHTQRVSFTNVCPRCLL